MAEYGALDSFVAKWLDRHPEMAVLEAFCPPAGRRRYRAWGALTHELAQAMFATSEASVGRTKLAWWEQDLAAGPGGARHPVSRALLAECPGEALPAPADWRRLITAAIDLSEASRFAAAVVPPAAPSRAFADSLAAVEAQVFGRPSDPSAIAAALRLDRLLETTADSPADAAEPLGQLVDDVVTPGRGRCLFRNGRTAFTGWRQRRLARGARPAAIRRIPAVRTLLLAWSAARHSGR